jgi:ketosteroid isomerase-like protein
MAHPNEVLVRRGYEAFAKGDMEIQRELFDPEIVWHFPGRGVLAATTAASMRSWGSSARRSS